MKRFHVAVSLLVALTATAVYADNPKDAQPPPFPVPPVFRGGDPSPTPTLLADFKWFDVFRDPQLQVLVQTALRQNASLRLAITRVEVERANLGLVHANQLPTVTVGGNYNTDTVSTNTPNFFPGLEHRTTTLGEGILNLLSFEVDIWGRLRNQTRAARAELNASEEDRRTVMTVVVTDVAANYFDLLDLDAELDIDQRTLAARSDSLVIINAREQGGLASMLDVRQGQQLVQQAALNITDTKRQIEQAENNIDLLLGNPPGPIARGPSLSQTALPEVPAGLPSELLLRRADIRAAEQNVEAQHYLVALARAAFFPALSLTGFLGYQSSTLRNLFTSGSYTGGAVPTITGALYPSEALHSNLELAKANQRLALTSYRAAVLTALRDVSNALVEYASRRELLLQQETLVTTLKDRANLAYLRYNGGVDTLLNALDADRDLLNAQLSAAQARRDELLALVQLYKALGGGWQD